MDWLPQVCVSGGGRRSAVAAAAVPVVLYGLVLLLLLPHLVEQDVLRLHVSVDDAPLVQVLEGEDELGRVEGHEIRGEGAQALQVEEQLAALCVSQRGHRCHASQSQVSKGRRIKERVRMGVVRA